MKKDSDREMDDDLRPEYDLTQLLKGGVRGKYAERYRSGTNLALLAPDVAHAFPTEEAVNQALRKKNMNLVDEFIARYKKEYDFYDQAARLISQLLERNLQSAGIRAIVTLRAKSPSRLEAKVHKRSTEKNYKTIDDIYKDIVDLAGVRAALYF